MRKIWLSFIVVAILILPGCEKKASKAVTLTAKNFEEIVLKSKQPVLVDFWAEWCGPCREMDPVIRELANAYEGKIVVGKVNIDDYPKIADAFDVKGIPTFLVFKDGALKKRFVGITPKESLNSLLGALQ